MTDIAETALAFCREVRKWRKAEFSGTSFKEVMWVNAPGGTRFLRFEELGAVMEAVKEWCRQNTASLSLHWSPFEEGKNEYFCFITFPTKRKCGSAASLDPCEAVMRACLEAARVLKEAA